MPRSSLVPSLLLPSLLLIAGCGPAASSGPTSANAPTSTTAATSTPAPTKTPVPTPTTVAPTAHCPQLPAAQPGQEPSATLSLYVVTLNNALAALNASDGSPRWKEPIAPAGGRVDSVAVKNNVVYAAIEDGTIEALNASDGSQLWQAQPEALLLAARTALSTRPASSGTGITFLTAVSGAVYVSQNGKTAALNASDGKQQWSAAGAALAVG